MTAFLNTNPTPRKKSAHPFSSLERSKKVAASTTRVLLLRVAVGVFLRRLVLLLRQKSVDAAHVSTAKTTLFDEMCLLFRLLLMTTTLCATKKYTTWETNLEKVSINLDKGARETTLFVFFFSKSLAWMENFRFVSSSSSSHSSSQKKRGEESGRRSEKRKRERL